MALSVGESVGLRFVDADVEEPNAALLLHPHITEETVVTVDVPDIDENRCNHCGECAKACRFNALAVLPDKVMLFEQLCHSCGTCALVCPQDAVGWRRRRVGRLRRGYIDTPGRRIEFIEGRMDVGEARTPPLIEALKELLSDERHTLVDASPGVGCGVVETMRIADFVLLVTEPTPFGMNDLEMAAEAVKRLSLPAGVVVNRATYGDLAALRDLSGRLGLEVLLELPFDREVAEGYSRGEVVYALHGEWRRRFEALWWEVSRRVAKQEGVPWRR